MVASKVNSNWLRLFRLSLPNCRNKSLPSSQYVQHSNFFWGPRNPFDDMDRELKRFEDQFRRWNRELLNSWENHSKSSSLPTQNQDKKGISLFNSSVGNKSLESEQTYVDKDGNKNLKLSFDVANFKPEDIKVKIDNKCISITAKNHIKSEKGTIYREFYREYLLPEDVDNDNIKSHLSPNGTLMLEVPYKHQLKSGKGEHVEIPIEKKDNQSKI
ncbi:unnamed protein product [Gordionus sp. m RMFG-2023]|uniref:alpha-crystallin A chain-like n=1 Tax=Gordionus sp. m RMFG-2023 TaxID=3053472 RepID=UPI0030E144E1